MTEQQKNEYLKKLDTIRNELEDLEQEIYQDAAAKNVEWYKLGLKFAVINADNALNEVAEAIYNLEF